MQKLIVVFLMLFAFATTSFAQCNLPTYTFQANKNRIVIEAVQFVPDLYKWQWSADGVTWLSVDAKLHAISSPRCVGNQPCTYTVGIVKNTYSGALWYGIQDGWQVRFARQCSDGSWSAFSTPQVVSNVK